VVTELEFRLLGPLGAALLTGAIGALTLAIVKVPEWGWQRGQLLGWFAVALLGLTAYRSRRHPTPVLDTSLLRVRAFAIASAASLVFNLGLSALFLGTVLFLTGVWGYSVLGAGLALSAAGGSLLFAAGTASFILSLSAEPRYGGGCCRACWPAGSAGSSAWPSWSPSSAPRTPPTLAPPSTAPGP
jgi:hypothetical protein